MKPKVRNHLASLCMRYVAKFNPEDFKDLAELSEENYSHGFRNETLETVFRKFIIQRKELREIEAIMDIQGI